MLVNTTEMHAGQRGFSLIELSVAAAVLSIGLAGLSLMMNLAVGGTADAQHRSLAAMAAGSLAETILMNPAATEHFINPAPLMQEDCTQHEHCSEGDLAAGLVNSWQAQIQSELPAGNGVVCLDSSPEDGSAANPDCDEAGFPLIKIFWGSPRDDNVQEPPTGRITYRLPRP